MTKPSCLSLKLYCNKPVFNYRRNHLRNIPAPRYGKALLILGGGDWDRASVPGTSEGLRGRQQAQEALLQLPVCNVGKRLPRNAKWQPGVAVPHYIVPRQVTSYLIETLMKLYREEF